MGHLTIDRLASGMRIGGSVAYAATTASRLGMVAGIATVTGQELEWASHLPGVEMVCQPAAATTTFENLYRGGRRTQRVLAMAEPVSPGAVPPQWRTAPIVHLAPVLHEVSGDLPSMFSGSLIGLTPQGLLRRWDQTGAVSQSSWTGDDRLLAGAQVLVFSEEDVAGDPTFLSRCLDRTAITILTEGAGGATLFIEGRSTRFPAFPVEEIDPTGAGDVFAAAFLIEYHLTGDPYHSTAFACCAASFVVERPGLEGIPDRRQVEQRLDIYNVRNLGRP